MKPKIPFGSAIAPILLCGLFLPLTACRKEGTATTTGEDVKKQAVVAPELGSNNVGMLPSVVYRSQGKSPIHWQPWTKESLDRAKAANRLVFGVIAMPQQPTFQRVLASLAADPALVKVINETYVPVLIDGDSSREMGLLTGDLCGEIKRALQLPLFVWMSPEGNPVAWIPAAQPQTAKLSEIFNRSHSMVSQAWADDSEYVMKNSALDNANRRFRFSKRKNTKVMSQQPADDLVRALRQLASLYDPATRTFDGAGGLFPAGAIDLLATAAVQPGLPPEIRTHCMDTTRDLLVDLLPSPMFDPLEGGVFVSRRGNSWALPIFYRDCALQSRVTVALLNAYRATGEKKALEKALGLIGYAEKNFITPDGLFAVGMTRETEPALWLWSVEEVEKELTAEEAGWWIKATGMKGLGNLPSELDPRREFFRANSLGIAKSVSELAADQGQPVEVFAPKYEIVRKKLLKARNLRLGDVPRDLTPHAVATLRMVSAYAAAFGATGESIYRDKAVALLKKAREAFSVGPKLRLFAENAPASIGEGRAFLYGLALQAAVDVAVIASDEAPLVWSEDLATTAAEQFTTAEFLKECPDDAKIIDLPITDLVMVFDDSTAGLVSFAECRLAEQGRPLVPTFSELAIPLPTYSVDRPILHTDLLQATLARQFKVTVVMGAALSPDMKLAIERLPMRMIQRRPSKADDKIPDGSVKVIFNKGEGRLAATPAELQQVLLPSS